MTNEKTTLKTLKEMGEFCDYSQAADYRDGVSLKELREEAIKWVKELRNPPMTPYLVTHPSDGKFYADGKEISEEMYKRLEMLNLFGNSISWIMHFFGISEEDLK